MCNKKIMQVSRDEKKAEAVKRMKEWGIYPEIIKQFEDEGIVSESAPPFGACYWLNDEQKARVAKFEKITNALVYHVIHSYTDFGELENYLYVSDYPNEWEMDHYCIKRGAQLCYVVNKDIPIFSEPGMIGIALTPASGLTRTW